MNIIAALAAYPFEASIFIGQKGFCICQYRLQQHWDVLTVQYASAMGNAIIFIVSSIREFMCAQAPPMSRVTGWFVYFSRTGLESFVRSQLSSGRENGRWSELKLLFCPRGWLNDSLDIFIQTQWKQHSHSSDMPGLFLGINWLAVARTSLWLRLMSKSNNS